MNIGHARRCLTPQTEEVNLIGYRNGNTGNFTTVAPCVLDFPTTLD
jgi:hypothetical protein